MPLTNTTNTSSVYLISLKVGGSLAQAVVSSAPNGVRQLCMGLAVRVGALCLLISGRRDGLATKSTPVAVAVGMAVAMAVVVAV